MSDQYTIELHGLTKYYGKHRGAEDVSFSVKPGEIFGFVGPNGAGKSTTIKLLLNHLYPSAGSAEILGMDVVSRSKEIKQQVAYVPCDVRYYAEMRVSELFETTRRFHGISGRDEEERLVADFKLETRKRFAELSTGNKKKVALVNAMLADPRVFILDEPTNGLDPLMQQILFKELRRRAEQGASILLSSHNLAEIQEHAGRVAFIKEGRILTIREIDRSSKPIKIITLIGGDPTPLLELGARIVSQDGGKIMLSYANDPEALAGAVAQAAPHDFLVRNQSLEEQFLEYYTEEGIKHETA